jgi:hypothetical protein
MTKTKFFWLKLTRVDLAWLVGLAGGITMAEWDVWYSPLVIGAVAVIPLWHIENMKGK